MATLNAFVAGLGAGIAFALCQSIAMWVDRRASRKRLEEAQRAVAEHMERHGRASAGLYAVDANGRGDVN